jgi:hypothetical protein
VGLVSAGFDDEMVQVPRGEWELLKERLAVLERAVEAGATDGQRAAASKPADDGRTDRRGLLKHSAMLAAGAVAGGGLLAATQASPAAASTGGLQYGVTNNSLGDPTTLYSSSDNFTLSLINTANGYVLGLSDNDQGTGAGLAVGMGNSDNESPGVQIYCETIGNGLDSTVISGPGTAILGTVSFDGLGTALAGEITNLSNHSPVIYASTASGPGLVAYAGGSYRGVYGQSNSGAGVYGFSSDGPGVQAQSSTERGVHGTSTSATGVFGESSTGHGVEGQITNPASAAYALHGVTAGTGSAIVGQVNNASSSAAGVLGITNGTGAAIGAVAVGPGAALSGLVYGGTGPALLGQIVNAGNSQPGVSASTNGTGPAVQGIASGTGVGLNASSAHGRGAVLAGAAAQAKLVPSAAATHPTAGQAGDLFVDSTTRLWFCTATGNPATWKQVQVA